METLKGIITVVMLVTVSVVTYLLPLVIGVWIVMKLFF